MMPAGCAAGLVCRFVKATPTTRMTISKEALSDQTAQRWPKTTPEGRLQDCRHGAGPLDNEHECLDAELPPVTASQPRRTGSPADHLTREQSFNLRQGARSWQSRGSYADGPHSSADAEMARPRPKRGHAPLKMHWTLLAMVELVRVLQASDLETGNV